MLSVAYMFLAPGGCVLLNLLLGWTVVRRTQTREVRSDTLDRILINQFFSAAKWREKWGDKKMDERTALDRILINQFFSAAKWREKWGDKKMDERTAFLEEARIKYLSLGRSTLILTYTNKKVDDLFWIMNVLAPACEYAPTSIAWCLESNTARFTYYAASPPCYVMDVTAALAEAVDAEAEVEGDV